MTYERRDADTEFPNHYPIDMMRSFYEKYVYEVLNHNTTTGITLTKDDFILPTTRTKTSITHILIFSLKTKNIIGKIQRGLTN